MRLPRRMPRAAGSPQRTPRRPGALALLSIVVVALAAAGAVDSRPFPNTPGGLPAGAATPSPPAGAGVAAPETGPPSRTLPSAPTQANAPPPPAGAGTDASGTSSPTRALQDSLNAVFRLKGEGHLEQAWAAAQQLVLEAPDFAPGIEAQVELARETGRLQSERGRWLQEAGIPGKPLAHYAVSLIDLELNAWSAALESGMAAVENGCVWWGCYQALATAFSRLERSEEGEAYFRQLASVAVDGERRGLALLGLADLVDDDAKRAGDAEAALEAALHETRNGNGREHVQRWLGNLYGRLNRFEPQLAAYQQSLAVHVAQGDRRWEANLLINLASVMSSQGNVRKAITLREEALIIQREQGNTRSVAIILGSQGLDLKQLGENERAAQLLEQAVDLSRSVGDMRRLAVWLGGLGSVYLERGEIRRAMGMFDQALEIHQRERDVWREGVTRVDQGMALLYLGDARGAMKRFEMARTLLANTGDPRGEAQAVAGTGSALEQLGELDQALAAYEEAVAIFHAGGNLSLEATYLGAIASIQVGMGSFQHGLTLYQQALDMHRRLENRGEEAVVLGNIGDTYAQLGDTTRALDYYEQALRLYRETDNRAFQAEVQTNMGRLALDRGALPEATRYLEAALEIFRAMGDTAREASATAVLGQVHLREGNPFAAEREFVTALRMARESGNPLEEGIALRGLANTRSTTDRAGAASLLEQAIAVDHRVRNRLEEVRARADLSRILEALARPGPALEQIDAALETAQTLTRAIGDPELEGHYFASTGSLYARKIHLLNLTSEGGDPTSAGSSASSRAFVLAEEARARSFHRRLLSSGLGGGGPLSEPVRRLREATTLLNRARLLLDHGTAPDAARFALEQYLEAQLEPYLKRQALSGGLPEAARVLQRQRAALIDGALPASEQQALLDQLYEQREREYAEAERAFMMAPEGPAGDVSPELATLASVQSALDERTVLVAYLMGEERSYGWAVSRRQSRFFELPSEAVLTASIIHLRASLVVPSSPLAGLVKEASALYRILMGPAEQMIGPEDPLVIVPDGLLGVLPFETLVSRWAPGESPAYLGVQHAIRYAASATVWRAGQAATGLGLVRGDLLAVGDPDYDVDPCDRGGQQARRGRGDSEDAAAAGTAEGMHVAAPGLDRLPRLCYSQDEIRAIRQSRRPGIRTRRGDTWLVRADATEQRLRSLPLWRYSIVHLSAHGLQYAEAPLRSALALGRPTSGALKTAGDGRPGAATLESDGYLELREIVHLPLRAELVVLSACDTALGRGRRGEGIESLARGFLVAGAGNVIASGWAVNDRTTSLFMGIFYRELRDRPIAEALLAARRAFVSGSSDAASPGPSARRSMGAELAHPFYWAPYMLLSGGSLGTSHQPK